MKVLYFAWLRERIGVAEETIEVPVDIGTIGALTDFLAARSPRHALAFADRRSIKTALDQVFVSPDTRLGGAGEVAYFPPFTGG